MTSLLTSVFSAGVADTFVNELQYLFAEMGVAAAVCFGLGMLFLIIEIFAPGFGFFGISGTVLVIAGMVLRATDHGSGNPLFQIILMFLIILIVCALAFTIMAVSAKKGWLSRTPFVMRESAVSSGITEGTVDYNLLIGKKGRSVSMLRPAGIAEIEGERYDVVALGEFIDPDKEIIVEDVEGVRIVVKEVKDIKNIKE